MVRFSVQGGTAMSSRLLTDELWNVIEQFFPQRPVSPLGGRPPADNRTVFTAILFVLKTGIAWEDLPLELGCSYKTCGRRLREWTAAGVWQKILLHLLTELRVAGRLELADVLIDAGLVKAPLGGQKPVRIRRIEAGVAASIIC
jgi:transposase